MSSRLKRPVMTVRGSPVVGSMVNEIGTAGAIGRRMGEPAFLQDAPHTPRAPFVIREWSRAGMRRPLGGMNGAHRLSPRDYLRLNSVSSTYRYITAIAVRF